MQHDYINDYQVNICKVVDKTGRIYQTMDYYPYGEPFQEWNWDLAEMEKGMSSNRYLYSGNERETGLGVNQYDFQARTYVASFPRLISPDPLASKNPGISVYSYCNGDPINLTDKTGEKPNPYEGSLMAAATYHDEDGKRAEEKLTKHKWFRIDILPECLLNPLDEEGNGTQITVFMRTANGKNEYACAFAGTDGVVDVIDDVTQLAGTSIQVHYAAFIGNLLSDILSIAEGGSVDLTFVGHSLGGCEAAFSAIKTGHPALTYNAAAVSNSTMIVSGVNLSKFSNYSIITNYVSSTPSILGVQFVVDPLTIIQDAARMPAVGHRVKVPVGWTPSHGIMDLVNALKK